MNRYAAHMPANPAGTAALAMKPGTLATSVSIMLMMRYRKGLTILELTLVSGLMAFVAMLLSSAWKGVGRPAAEMIARAQLAEEVDLAIASLSRDLGGSLGDPESRLGGKNLNQWVGWTTVATELWLCFDAGDNPDGQPDWDTSETDDAIIVYTLDGNALKRRDEKAATTFTVAKNVESLAVTAEGLDAVRIVISFKFRQLTRTCTLIAKMP